jgi:surface antigen
MRRRGSARAVRSGVLALSLLASVVVAITASSVAEAATSTRLCNGYSACSASPYTTHGYQNASSTRYWGMDPGDECTNYAAYVESTVYGVGTPSYSLGNAGDWATNAASHGVSVNSTPTVGAVAEWNADDYGMQPVGHVAVVEAVGPNNSYIVVSQQNIVTDTDGYDWEQIDSNQPSTAWEPWPDKFIHFNDSGGSGNPPSNGSFVSYQGNDYIIAGGAPLYVSSWQAYGYPPGSFPSTIIPLSRNQWQSLNQVPSNGTFLNFVSGPNGQGVGSYVIAGGAPLYVSSWSAYGLSSAPSSIVNVDSWNLYHYGNPLDVLHAVPSNGTYLDAYTASQQVGMYVVAGGAALPLSDCSILGGCAGSISIDDWDVQNAGKSQSGLNTIPANGALVEGLPSGNYWEFKFGGLLATSPSTAVQIDDSSLSAFSLDQPPTLSAPSTATFVEANPGTLSVSATGYPTPSFNESGTLPAGMSLVDNGDGTATLSGTPSQTGTFPITFTASNGVAPDATRNLMLNVVALEVTTTSLPVATKRVHYQAILSAQGGASPYKWSLAKGSLLPPGLTVATSGSISGTPTKVGTYTFKIKVASTATQSVPKDKANATLSIVVGK